MDDPLSQHRNDSEEIRADMTTSVPSAANASAVPVSAIPPNRDYPINLQTRTDATASVTAAASAAGPAPGSAAAMAPPGEVHPPVLTVIENRPGWQLVNVGEIWRFRELLFFLTWRDVKVRYKQTLLGAAWVILYPLSIVVVFTIFLGQVAASPRADLPYSLFVMAGILPWLFFSGTLNSAGQSVVSSQNLITKVYFPRLLIPIAAVGVGLVDFMISMTMLVGFMIYYGVPATASLLALPIIILGLIMAVMGIGIFLSALTVAYRDVRYLIIPMVQLWLFATPGVYLQDYTFLGPRWTALMPLNPAQGMIANFRIAILGGTLDWYAFAVSASVSIAFLTCGTLYFRRVERRFADII